MRRLQRHGISAGDSACSPRSKDLSAVLQGLWRKRARHTSSGEKGALARLAVFSPVDHVRLAPKSGAKADIRASTQWASCGQYEDVPPAVQMSPRRKEWFDRSARRSGANGNSICAVNPRCLTVYFRIGSSASDMRRRFSERGTQSGSTESAI
jgi:hypothetical protein